MEFSVSTEEALEAFYIDRMRDHLRVVLADSEFDYLDSLRVVQGGMSGSAIYRFSLKASDSKAPWAARPFICRAVGDEDLGSVAKEVMVHRTLHDLGYPLAEVLVYQDHADVLAAPFRHHGGVAGSFGAGSVFLADGTVLATVLHVCCVGREWHH